MKYIKEYKEIDWEDFDYEESYGGWVKVNTPYELSIGDIVKCSVRRRNNKIGKVVRIGNTIGVEFDEYINGHDCSGKGKNGYCWNVDFLAHNLRKKV